jgi:hypothetical protein
MGYAYHLSFRRTNLQRYLLNSVQVLPILLEAGPKSGINNSKNAKLSSRHFMQPSCKKKLQGMCSQGRFSRYSSKSAILIL